MPVTYLAGYDGSAESHAAVEFAVRMGKTVGAEVVAVHVYPHALAAYWVSAEAFQYDQIEDDLRREAEEIVARLDVPDVERQIVKADSPARGLHDLAETTGADLIAVGTTHHGRFGRLAPGSVGMHLLHGAPCRVMVVPPDCGDRPVETIGVAYDGREEARSALHTADELAQRLGARLVVLGVKQPLMVPVGIGAIYPVEMVEGAERAFENMLERAAGEARVDAEACTLAGPPASALVDASGDVDLLVTGSRGYGSIGGVVLGSVSRHLVDHAACPVLVVPRPAVTR